MSESEIVHNPESVIIMMISAYWYRYIVYGLNLCFFFQQSGKQFCRAWGKMAMTHKSDVLGGESLVPFD